MLLSDKTIRRLCEDPINPLIQPYNPKSISKLTFPRGDGTAGEKLVCSFGSSSYGYDLSLGNKFKLLKTAQQATGARFIDPNNFDQSLFTDITVDDGRTFVIPPRGNALGVVKERVSLRRNMTAIAMQKSTIARCFLEVTVTPLEAEWEGYLTLEFTNKTDLPIHLTPGMGIVQMIILTGDEDCEVSYRDRGGKYQDQPAAPVAARIKNTDNPNPALTLSAAQASGVRRDYPPSVRGLDRYKSFLLGVGFPAELLKTANNVPDLKAVVNTAYEQVVNSALQPVFHNAVRDFGIKVYDVTATTFGYGGMGRTSAGWCYAIDVINALGEFFASDQSDDVIMETPSLRNCTGLLALIAYAKSWKEVPPAPAEKAAVTTEPVQKPEPVLTEAERQEAADKATVVASRDWLVAVGYPFVHLNGDSKESLQDLRTYVIGNYDAVLADDALTAKFHQALLGVGITARMYAGSGMLYSAEGKDATVSISEIADTVAWRAGGFASPDAQYVAKTFMIVMAQIKGFAKSEDGEYTHPVSTGFGDVARAAVVVGDGAAIFDGLLKASNIKVLEGYSPEAYLTELYENILKNANAISMFNSSWGGLTLAVGGGYKYGYSGRWKSPEEIIRVLREQADLADFQARLEVAGSWEHAGHSFVKALGTVSGVFPETLPLPEEALEDLKAALPGIIEDDGTVNMSAVAAKAQRISTQAQEPVADPSAPVAVLEEPITAAPTPSPLDPLKTALQSDDSYAFSWDANLVASFQDRFTPEQQALIPGFVDLIRQGAADFMSRAFGVDMTKVNAGVSNAAEIEQLTEATAARGKEQAEKAMEQTAQVLGGYASINPSTKLEDLKGVPFYATGVLNRKTYTDQDLRVNLLQVERFILSVSPTHIDPKTRNGLCILNSSDNRDVFVLIKLDAILQALIPGGPAIPVETAEQYRTYLTHYFGASAEIRLDDARRKLADMGYTLVSE